MLSLLKKEIESAESKMISYATFMEIALYHETLGYYMKNSEKIGRQGDFFTTSNISNTYGKLVAKWFYKLVNELNLHPAVCEIGAGTGLFAKAFIEEWNSISEKELYYFIVEESPYHRERQREVVSFNDRVKQIDCLEEVEPFNGLIFSNELFDAFPVHVVEKRDHQLYEVMITLNENELVEKLVPLQNDEIYSFMKKNTLQLKNNQRIEIPLAMEQMITRISSVLNRGIVLTVDYGYDYEEWMESIHRKGSLRGYYKHQQMNNVLKHPGEMDITTHIHFDALIHKGEEVGLALIKKVRQEEFFMLIGILDELQNHYDPNPFSEVSRKNRAIRSLIMPGGISSYFHAIIQKKGLNLEEAARVIEG